MVSTRPETEQDAPMAPLRGARVEIDARRVGWVAAAACLMAAAAVAIVLTVAGFQKNDQITSLKTQGIPVDVTVTHCIGLMGGSGSNLDGFSCSGRFQLASRTYVDPLPGSGTYQVGSSVRAITVRSDPSLLATRGELANEQASWRVFITPIVLFGLLLVALGVLLAMARRSRRARAAQPR